MAITTEPSAQPENPYSAVIAKADGPLLIEQGAMEPDRVARTLFDYMQRVLTVCDEMEQPPPTWIDCFSDRMDRVLHNPALVVRVANAYAAARKQGFVVEPQDPSKTPCGISAADAFDKKVAEARDHAGEGADPRYHTPEFGFDKPDLRAVWSSENGRFLIEFLMLLASVLKKRSDTDFALPVPPAGSTKLWRAFLDFEDPLKPADATAAATAPEEAVAEGAPSWPEWVTAEDRWERLDMLYEIFQERLRTSTDYNAILRHLLTPPTGKDTRSHYDVDFLMGFLPDQMRAVLPHLIERARLSGQNLRLFQEACASWVHCPLPRDSSVYTMPPHKLVELCWLSPDSDPATAMSPEDSAAVFGGSIQPKTFAILRTYIGEEWFKRLDVEKIQFADRLQREGTFNAFLKYIGADSFMNLPLNELQRDANLGVEFFEAVVESPKPDATATALEPPQEIPQETRFRQAIDRLDMIRGTDRESLMEMVLNAQELGSRGRADWDILRDLSSRRAPTPRMVALKLMRDIPVERLAQLPSSHHQAALIQNPTLAEGHLLTLEQMPIAWLSIALNVHLKSLPALDADRLKAALLRQRKEEEAAADSDPEMGAIIKNIVERALPELRYTRPDVDPEDEFRQVVLNFHREMQELLRCPGPDVLCAFVEHHGHAKAESMFYPPPGSDDDNVDLMIRRKRCRDVNHHRALAASEPNVAMRQLLLRAYVDSPKNDVWRETPTRFHSMGSYKFEDFLRDGHTPDDWATLASTHRLVACLVQFGAEQRQAAEPADAEPPDLINVPL